MGSKHVRKIIQKMAEGNTQEEIARDLGISQPAVSLSLARLKYCPHCHKPLFKDKGE